MIMNCKELAAQLKREIKADVEGLSRSPTLVVVMVGDNPASQIYVRNKAKDCEECGIDCKVIHLPENIDTVELKELIHSFNKLDYVDGIMVQLPLPKHIDEAAILKAIHPYKDVDGLTFENFGKLAAGSPYLVPCTPVGILYILDYFNIEVDGKRCVVIGRSNIVGKPMSILLTNLGGTVTLCHSHTQNLSEITQQADIIVCAVGKEKIVTADMVKESAVVIDVGINRDENGKLCGDVDFENVSKKCSAITPVPGGVGLMTRVALLKNVLLSYYR